MSDLAELLVRVKAATGPDREIDRAIERLEHGPDVIPFTPAYTASIDAALALVERVLPGWFVDHMGADVAGSIGDMKTFGWMVEISDGMTGYQGQAPILPLAILLALIQALGETP